MQAFERAFIDLAIKQDVLCFGEFTLKSGRISPFFFNAGKFNTGSALAGLGQCYAQAILHHRLECDVLFGPAYKGIPLVTTVSIAMADHGRDLPYCFNRKESKDHGEGGKLVGADIRGKRVLIVDDVITAGTAIREVMVLLKAQGAVAAGVVIGLDRQERGLGRLSAVDETREQYGMPVVSVVNLQTIIEYLCQDPSNHVTVEKVRQYQQQYGVV